MDEPRKTGLELTCTCIYEVLHQEMDQKHEDTLSQSALRAIDQVLV